MHTTHFLVVGDNGHVAPLADSSRVQAAMAGTLALCSPRADSAGRPIWDTHQVSLRMLERNLDATIGAVRADAQAIRGDAAFSAGMGMMNPRDLTHRFRTVLEERHQPRQSLEVFPVNTEVPPGALSYEQYRAYSTGEAVVYRGGSGADITEVGIGQASFNHPVVYLVAKASINWLENLSANMVGLNTQERKMRAARLAIEQLEDEWVWKGAQAHGLYGLLNHPYVDTALGTVPYSETTTDADDIAADFGTWANYADNESGGAYQPDTLLIAPKLANYLRNRKYDTNAAKSLLDWMLGANPHIKSVKTVAKLNDAGGAGIHAMAFVRGGAGAADSSCEIVKPLTPTLLTPDQRSLVTEMFLVSGFGGLNQREVGDNLVVYVQGPA